MKFRIEEWGGNNAARSAYLVVKVRRRLFWEKVTSSDNPTGLCRSLEEARALIRHVVYPKPEYRSPVIPAWGVNAEI